jgi:hypothetical protein
MHNHIVFNKLNKFKIEWIQYLKKKKIVENNLNFNKINIDRSWDKLAEIYNLQIVQAKNKNSKWKDKLIV